MDMGCPRPCCPPPCCPPPCCPPPRPPCPPPPCPPPPPCCPPPCCPSCCCPKPSLLFVLLKNALVFGAGVYTGVYIAQNYEIEKVDDPQVLFEKIKTFVNEKLGQLDNPEEKKKSK